jgi:hypothetical protein
VTGELGLDLLVTIQLDQGGVTRVCQPGWSLRLVLMGAS